MNQLITFVKTTIIGGLVVIVPLAVSETIGCLSQMGIDARQRYRDAGRQ